MHYHLATTPATLNPKNRKLLGLVCLAVFLALVGKVWVPYAQAMANATAIKFLPPEWAESYIAATLPKTHAIDTGNWLTIKTKELSIRAPIVEGVSPDDLLKGVGRDPASVVPGRQGRLVISGHRFWPSASPWATVFFSLDRLKVGDFITLQYSGQEYRYKVTETWNVPKDEARPYLAPTTQPILTMYTCGPTPYSAKNRLGFNAILDQGELQQESGQVIQTLQDGLLTP